jgi:7-cyano-7-deazaguanine synthase
MKAIVILSGGPDSTAAALWALANRYAPELVTFQFRNESQYGELRAAITVAGILGLPHKIIDFKSPLHVFNNNMHIMMHAGVPKMSEDKSKPYLMPFGSGTLLAYTSSYAIHEGISTIVWGATADDAANHAEYTQGFCNQMAALVKTATGHDLNIIAPFNMLHKPQVLETFSGKLDLFSSTWSCRTQGNIQCGICEGCVARRVSAEVAGVCDQTTYANPLNVKVPNINKPLDQYSQKDWEDLNKIAPLNCEDSPQPIPT